MSSQSTYHCKYRLKARWVHKHDWREYANIDDKADELLSGDLCRLG